VWWLASTIGLEQGLIIYMDYLQSRESTAIRKEPEPHQASPEDFESEYLPAYIYPDWVPRMGIDREISTTPRDLTNNQRTEQILDCTEQFIDESVRARSTRQRSRLNPLPHTKAQLKKTRKMKRLQEARKKQKQLGSNAYKRYEIRLSRILAKNQV